MSVPVPPARRSVFAITGSILRPSSWSHGRRVLALVLLAGLPAVTAWAACQLFALPAAVELALLSMSAGWWLLGSFLAHRTTVGPLNTLSGLLAGIRRGDFSMRSSLARPDDPLGVVMLETNALVETMRAQRLGALEATALLRTVMAEIEVAIFAFDDEERLRLANRAAEHLLGRPRERLEGQRANDLGLAELLDGPVPRTVELAFAGSHGRGELRRSRFRQHGRPHVLVVLADLSRALREEELTAWRRLVRVLSHEINNSLTPIASAAGSLQRLVDPARRDADWQDDLRGGLELIEGRAKALGRFMRAYAKLARLPPPDLAQVDIESVVHRVVQLQGDPRVRVDGGPAVTLLADRDQLEQALINLVANAVDAVEEHGSAVRIDWRVENRRLCICISDDGPGVGEATNLFVPFFSTKPGGSGIGLALCRQIAESHGGWVDLATGPDDRGCQARLELPVEVNAPAIGSHER